MNSNVQQKAPNINVTFEDIKAARARISSHISLTPTERSRNCSRLLNTDVYLKFENQQLTGSFKIRGALNKLLKLKAAGELQPIVASSAGNHAQGVAYAARLVNIPSCIVMPVNASLVKVMATENYGARVVLAGEVYDEAYQKAREIERTEGYLFVPPFADADIIAGQGTIGLELIEAIPDLDSVVVAIGGGGLISGIATAIKTLRPSCRIYGVVAERSAAMYDRFHALPEANYDCLSIADGIAVKKPNSEIFNQFIKPLVTDVVKVSEGAIAEAVVFLLERAKAVVEGSCAITLAAAQMANWDLGKKTCLVLGGGNIDGNNLTQVIQRGLFRLGRLSLLKVKTPDRPGSLLKISQILAQFRANILEVHHDRIDPSADVKETLIRFLIETRGHEHIREIQSALANIGWISEFNFSENPQSR